MAAPEPRPRRANRRAEAPIVGRALVPDVLLGGMAGKGRTLEKLYFGYTTCPKCAKAYGKNYVVLFAKVGEPAAPRA